MIDYQNNFKSYISLKFLKNFLSLWSYKTWTIRYRGHTFLVFTKTSWTHAYRLPYVKSPSFLRYHKYMQIKSYTWDLTNHRIRKDDCDIYVQLINIKNWYSDLPCMRYPYIKIAFPSILNYRMIMYFLQNFLILSYCKFWI